VFFISPYSGKIKTYGNALITSLLSNGASRVHIGVLNEFLKLSN